MHPQNKTPGFSRPLRPARRRPAWAVLLPVLALLSACGGSDSGPPDFGMVEPEVPAAVVAACDTAFQESIAPLASLQPGRRSASVGLSAAEASEIAPVNLSQCPVGSNRDVTIGSTGCGPNVVIDRSFTGNDALGRITIAANGKLVLPRTFDRLEVETAGIQVAGLLSLGTASCPVGVENLDSQVRIVFTGNSTDARGQGDAADKGIDVLAGGTLRMFGAKGVVNRDDAPDTSPDGVSWTHLSQPAGPTRYQDKAANIGAPVPVGGERTLHLARDVSQGRGAWRPGDWIVVATSSFSPFESEFVQIDGLEPDGSGGTVLRLRHELRHYHFGGGNPGVPSAANYGAKADVNFGVDERSAVGLISRSVVLTARMPAVGKAAHPDDRHWGGEIRLLNGFAEASIQGVELEKFGKARLGSYPIHLHMTGDISGRHLVNSNSIHHSYNKCVTLHATQGARIKNNVCARAVGHLFYQEWALEQKTEFLHNLGIGAMSHHFGLDAALPKAAGGRVQGYWEGDNLALDNQYDGLNVPNRDDQYNPTRGGCFTLQKDGGSPIFQRVAPCEAGQTYIEPASGFWIGNPGTILEGNAIAGCQGVGKAYWYVPPAFLAKASPAGDAPSVPPGYPADMRQRFEPVGKFLNNRAHACYDGLFGEPHMGTAAEQLFPRERGEPGGRSLVATFSGFTATRIRNRAVWMRPVWNVIEDGRFATNRDSVTLVSSGGTDGNAPGSWALMADSVLVGVSTNNVDRWGPCADRPGALAGGIGNGCVDHNKQSNELLEYGYQTPYWNSAGYMIYDGPARLLRNHFVNFLVDPRGLLTHADRTILEGFNSYPHAATVYEGDAALGWFQNNQSAYPTTTVSRALSFDNVKLRHQIYTEHVNLGQFRDGDMNTAIIDLDGTLTGYRVVDQHGQIAPGRYPVSLNNLPFNRAGNAVDECMSTGAQDALAEGRATSIISPASIATLEFETYHPASGVAGWQDMTFTKDSKDAGARQSMRLFSRNGQSVWEPKVADGYGYTVAAAPTSLQLDPNAPGVAGAAGMPRRISVGFTDAVKPDMDRDPFRVRLGVCYSDRNGRALDSSKFTIRRGYKSWGGNGVNYNDSGIWYDFNRYDGSASRYRTNNGKGDKGQVCFNLDAQNKENLQDCPGTGYARLEQGQSCPAGAEQKTIEGMNWCMFPTTALRSVSSLEELTHADGSARADDKFYFDPQTGMLFFYVVQNADNAQGVAPLGSCSGGNQDASCPDDRELDTYYPCPPQGCVNYVIELNDPDYLPEESACAYDEARYGMPEPVSPYRLANVDAPDGAPGPVVQARPVTSPQGFLHWVPDRAPWCPVTTVPVGRSVREQAFSMSDPLRTMLASVADVSLAASAWSMGRGVRPAPTPLGMPSPQAGVSDAAWMEMLGGAVCRGPRS